MCNVYVRCMMMLMYEKQSIPKKQQKILRAARKKWLLPLALLNKHRAWLILCPEMLTQTGIFSCSFHSDSIARTTVPQPKAFIITDVKWGNLKGWGWLIHRIPQICYMYTWTSLPLAQSSSLDTLTCPHKNHGLWGDTPHWMFQVLLLHESCIF